MSIVRLKRYSIRQRLLRLNGKDLTLAHPSDFVNQDNYRIHTRGHVQNVRKGREALESGEWPLVGDIIVKDKEAIDNIEAGGMRSLSCGYEYALKREGDVLMQTMIRGNHVALVQRGRAGPEARINDEAAAELALVEAAAFVPPANEMKADAVDVALPVTTKSEVKPGARRSNKKGVTMEKPKWVNRLLALGYKALANDADTKPEELEDAMQAVKDGAEPMSEEEKKKLTDAASEAAAEKEKKNGEDAMKTMRDSMEAEHKADKEKAVKDALDARDAEEAGKEKHYQPCAVKDCMDRDCSCHRAMDTMLEAHPKKEGEDADME